MSTRDKPLPCSETENAWVWHQFFRGNNTVQHDVGVEDAVVYYSKQWYVNPNKGAVRLVNDDDSHYVQYFRTPEALDAFIAKCVAARVKAFGEAV